MFEVNVSCRGIDAFSELVGAERVEAIKQLALAVQVVLGARAIWNIRSGVQMSV